MDIYGRSLCLHDAFDVGLSDLEVAFVAGNDGRKRHAELCVSSAAWCNDAEASVERGSNDVGHGRPAQALCETGAR